MISRAVGRFEGICSFTCKTSVNTRRSELENRIRGEMLSNIKNEIEMRQKFHFPTFGRRHVKPLDTEQTGIAGCCDGPFARVTENYLFTKLLLYALDANIFLVSKKMLSGKNLKCMLQVCAVGGRHSTGTLWFKVNKSISSNNFCGASSINHVESFVATAVWFAPALALTRERASSKDAKQRLFFFPSVLHFFPSGLGSQVFFQWFLSKAKRKPVKTSCSIFLPLKGSLAEHMGGCYTRLEARRLNWQDMSELDCVGAIRESHLPHQVSNHFGNLKTFPLDDFLLFFHDSGQVSGRWYPDSLEGVDAVFVQFCTSGPFPWHDKNQVFYLVFVLLPKFALWLVRSPGRLLWLNCQCPSLEGLLLGRNFATVVEIDMVHTWQNIISLFFISIWFTWV